MSPKRKRIGRYGKHGDGASVFLDARRCTVEWYADGTRRRQSFPRTREGQRAARDFARGVAHEGRLVHAGHGLTVAALWDRYTRSQDWKGLREVTQEKYATQWRSLQTFLTRPYDLQHLTLADADAFHTALADRGIVGNQIAQTFTEVGVVLNWAVRYELLRENPWARYRLKGLREHALRPAEYRTADFEAILAQLSPQSSRTWRPWAVLMVMGHQGPRARSALHLRWEDVDMVAGRITWPAGYWKNRKAHHQPLRDGTRSALFTAWDWRERDGYGGPWVFYSSWGAKKHKGREAPGVHGMQALWKALKGAEARAGVPALPRRSTHGFRKMVAGEVYEETRDLVLAAQFIGDTELTTLRHYLKPREDRLTAVAAQLDRRTVDV